VSHAGKRAGLRPDTRTGLWTQMAYAIDQLRPRLVVAENVRGLLSAQAHSDVEPCPWCVGDRPGGYLRALGAVLGDVADLGYDASWYGLRAADVGAPHGRFRVFLVAYPDDGRRWEPDEGLGRFPVAHSLGQRPVDLLPTPVAAEGHKPSNTMGVVRRQATGQVFLTNVVVSLAGLDPSELLLPTPTAVDYKASGGGYNGQSNVTLTDATVRNRNFGQYAAAVARWETVLGRPAPDPTEPTGRNNARRLSPRFVEWMMGLPEGWVTHTPNLTRNEALKALGNGVVPQQAEAALRMLLPMAVTA
jgi:DNA (cytosine-5)-methyltransferase 1